MTGTSPIRRHQSRGLLTPTSLNAIKYKNDMRVPISHRNFNICHFPKGLLK